MHKNKLEIENYEYDEPLFIYTNMPWIKTSKPVDELIVDWKIYLLHTRDTYYLQKSLLPIYIAVLQRSHIYNQFSMDRQDKLVVVCSEKNYSE
jgi:hypothetical protein